MHQFKYVNQEIIYGGFLWAAPPPIKLRSGLRRLSCLLVSWPGCPLTLVTPLMYVCMYVMCLCKRIDACAYECVCVCVCMCVRHCVCIIVPSGYDYCEDFNSCRLLWRQITSSLFNPRDKQNIANTLYKDTVRCMDCENVRKVTFSNGFTIANRPKPRPY